jgi:hypothetical protein
MTLSSQHPLGTRKFVDRFVDRVAANNAGNDHYGGVDQCHPRSDPLAPTGKPCLPPEPAALGIRVYGRAPRAFRTRLSSPTSVNGFSRMS